MAIAFSHQGTNRVASGKTAAATVTVNAGDTVIVYVADDNNSTFTVTDDASGGSNVYTRLNGASNTPAIQVFATSASGAAAATTITATTAAANEKISVAGLTYTGVSAIGISANTSGSSTAPAIARGIQDQNNYIVAGFAWFSGGADAAVANVGNLRANAAATVALTGIAGVDNTSATLVKLTGSVTLGTTTTWPAALVELRTGTSNPYNDSPILIANPVTSGWKSNQTLYSSSTTAVGIRPQKVIWTNRAPSVTNTFSILDPNDSTVLLQGSSVDGATAGDLQYDFEEMNATWRDFKVPTLSSGILLIYYRV